MSTPPIPTIPKSADPETRRFLEAVKTLLEIRAGDRGPVTDRFVTVGDLADASLVEVRTSIARGFDRNKSIVSRQEVDAAAADQPQTPAGVTNLQTNVTATSIILTWDYDFLYPLGYFEIYRAVATNSAEEGEDAVYQSSLSGAQVISVYRGQTFVDQTVDSGTAYAYWVRAIGPTGLAGPYNALDGTIGVATVDIIGAIATQSQAIKQSHLSSLLTTKIDTASTDAASAVTTASGAATDAASAIITAGSAATDASNAATDASSAATAASSAATAASTAATSASTAETAASNAATSASTAVTTASSAATAAASAVTTADSASAAAAAATTTANSASTAAASAVADASSALTTANGVSSSLTTLTSDLEASHIVKTSVEGKIAGFGLFNDGTTSDFQILADRFAITSSQTLIEEATRVVNSTTDAYFIWDADTPKQLRAYVDDSGEVDVLKLENDSNIAIQVKIDNITFAESDSETGFNSITIAANATANVSTVGSDFAGITVIYIRPDETIIDATPFIVSDGVVYINTAIIEDASIQEAKLGNLSADKITTGTLDANAVTISNLTVDVASVSGNISDINNAWIIDADGNAGFDEILVKDSLIVSGTLQGETLAATKIFLTQPITRVRDGVTNPDITNDTHWALFSNDFGGADDRKSLDAQRVTRTSNNSPNNGLVVTFPDVDVDGFDGTRETYQALIEPRGHTLTINHVIQAGSFQFTRNSAWYKRTWRVIDELGATVWEFTGGITAGSLGQNNGNSFAVRVPVDTSATYDNEVSYATGQSQYARSTVSADDNDDPDIHYFPQLGVDISGGADGWWADSITFTNVKLVGNGPFNVQLQLDLWYDNWSDGWNAAGLKVTGYAQLGFTDRTKFDVS